MKEELLAVEALAVIRPHVYDPDLSVSSLRVGIAANLSVPEELQPVVTEHINDYVAWMRQLGTYWSSKTLAQTLRGLQVPDPERVAKALAAAWWDQRERTAMDRLSKAVRSQLKEGAA